MSLSAFSVELTVRMVVGNCWLPVLTVVAEPHQEGGGIARAWIADTKAYPVYQCLDVDVCTRSDSGGDKQQFCKDFEFLLIILAMIW